VKLVLQYDEKSCIEHKQNTYGSYHWAVHCHHSGQAEEHGSRPDQEPVVDEQLHLLPAEAILQKV
jgi:hypothetical protein